MTLTVLHLALTGGDVFRLVPFGLVEGPDVAVVVAIGDGHGFQHPQAGDGGNFTQGIVKGHTQIPTQAMILGARGEFLAEGRGGIAHPRVHVHIGVVEHGEGGAFQQLHHRIDGAAHLAQLLVELAPQLFQSGELADGQVFDTRILEQGDEHHLRRTQGFGGQRLAGIDQVRGGVGGGGAVQFVAANAGVIVEGVGEVDHPLLDEGFVALAAFVIAGGGTHEEIAAP